MEPSPGTNEGGGGAEPGVGEVSVRSGQQGPGGGMVRGRMGQTEAGGSVSEGDSVHQPGGSSGLGSGLGSLRKIWNGPQGTY